jgi:hypothetical protein
MKQQPNVAEFFLTPEDMKALAPKARHDTGIKSATQPKVDSRAKRTDAFATIPLSWAVRANKASRDINFMVCVDLAYRAWRAKPGKRFTMPNRKGVDRRTKIHTLRALEKAGLITVEWRERKSPVVTLVVSIF